MGNQIVTDQFVTFVFEGLLIAEEGLGNLGLQNVYPAWTGA